MKNKRFKKYMPYFLVIFAAGSQDYAQVSDNLGQITKANGQVFVRSSGKWQALNNYPYSIKSNDKIVTRQGRVELNINGGSIYLDSNTNMGISKSSNISGLFSDTSQKSDINIKLLTGNLSFNIENNQNYNYSIKTPALTANLTEGGLDTVKSVFVVSADGSTEYKSETGKLSNLNITGKAVENINISVLTSNDVLSSNMPPVNTQIDNLHLQKALAYALSAQNEINMHMAKDRDQAQISKDYENQKFTKESATADMKEALSRSQTALAMAKSNKAVITESLSEAIWLKDLNSLQALKEIRLKNIEKIEEINRNINELYEIEREVAMAASLEKASNKAILAKIKANSIIANASYSDTLTSLGIAISNSDNTNLNTLDMGLKQINQKIIDIESAYAEAKHIEATRDTISYTDTAEANRIALKTFANASAIAASCSRNSSGSLTGIKHCQMAASALQLAKEAAKLAETGQLEKVKLAWANTENIMLGQDTSSKVMTVQDLMAKTDDTMTKTQPETSDEKQQVKPNEVIGMDQQEQKASDNEQDQLLSEISETEYSPTEIAINETIIEPPIDPMDLPMASSSI
ncbi:MAG: FecR domain-containing protein [Spirochaetia bacterium]|nr:FecR domain-containing protein [Spirochaetia bacterium]